MPRLSNERWEAFAQAFAVRRHFADAAKAAGSQAENLSAAGAELFAYPEVKARVRELARKQLAPLKMDATRLLTEVSRLATIDYRRFYHEDGSQKAPHELDDDEAACVRGVDRAGRFQFWDKNPPTQLLAKHFKLIGDEGDGVNALASALADRLNAARKRGAAPAPRGPVPVIDTSTPEPEPEPDDERMD